MNKTRWVVASIVVAVIVIVMESIFHGVFLKGIYEATAAIWRPYAEMSKLTPYGWISTLITSFILVYIYHRGYEGKGSALAEGLRFGFVIGLFTAVPMAVWSYIIIPMPFNLACYWFGIGMADMIVAGALIGLIYKKAAPSA
jgi:hypothetical protein